MVLVSAYASGLLDLRRLADGVPAIGVLMGEMFPPNFSDAASWVRPILSTLAMSIAGTALAVLFALPLGFLAARNATPGGWVDHIAWVALNVLRSIPELIMGILFVAAVGFGALPGVLALGLPQFADVAVYRWEYNFRASTVMGMVGAGGIGFELMASLRIMNYAEVSAILIAILVMVSGVDALGALVRRSLK